MSKWGKHEADIRAMVLQGRTDNEIGAIYGASGVTIWRVRKELGIPSIYNATFKRNKPAFNRAAEGTRPPLEGETYVDAAGLTVTRYPARYAAPVQGVTARPRRG